MTIALYKHSRTFEVTPALAVSIPEYNVTIIHISWMILTLEIIINNNKEEDETDSQN